MQSAIEENQNISNKKSKQINSVINIIFIGLFMVVLFELLGKKYMLIIKIIHFYHYLIH